MAENKPENKPKIKVERKIKLLLAKPGLDGHDVGVKVLAYALRDAGFDVVYTGLRKSIEQIVDRAKAERADVIGFSILSGTHEVLCEKMRSVMEERKLFSLPWVVGGNIPENDVVRLMELGAAMAFPTGTRIETVIEFMRDLTHGR